jgi:hypothetical protein
MDMYTQDNMVGYQAAIAGKPAPTRIARICRNQADRNTAIASRLAPTG